MKAHHDSFREITKVECKPWPPAMLMANVLSFVANLRIDGILRAHGVRPGVRTPGPEIP